MKFDINNYKGKYTMHCKTEEEAKNFCAYLDSIGERWCDGFRYTGHLYGGNIVYYFNEGSYYDISQAKEDNYTILEWKDFMIFTKADLKTGDIVLFRNGDIGICIREFNSIITREKRLSIRDDICNNLTALANKPYDIMAVRRPRWSAECTYEAFERKRGTLVYERKEEPVEEMTLEQVCKILGKQIKIIK